MRNHDRISLSLMVATVSVGYASAQESGNTTHTLAEPDVVMAANPALHLLGSGGHNDPQSPAHSRRLDRGG
jgi:hypothetical protein